MIDFAHEIPRSPVTTPAEPVRTKRRPATRVGPARRAVAVESPAPSPSPPTSAPPSSAPEPFPPADLVRLGDEIAELAAHLHAATYRLLVLVREFDQRGGWHTGFRSCAHWLSWRTGIAMGPAREKVRVAEALEHLQLLSERMRVGQLSYSKVRALTRVATADNERELMEFALHGTASHVERLVRAWKRVDRLEEQWQERERHRARSLTLYADEDGMYVIRGRLDPEVGALLMRALKAAGETLYGRSGGAGRSTNGDLPSDSSEVEPLTAPQRRADAIGLLAERGLQAGLGSSPADVTKTDAEETDDVSPTQDSGTAGQRLAQGAERVGTTPIGRDDRFQVVVHVDAEALRESSEVGECMLEGDVHVPAGTSRRIACDASRVVMTHAPDGSVLDVGRKTRTVPPAIRRALNHRDGGCRFPGCGLRFCDAHHIIHWADGGETRLDNLVLLCRHHHRAVHEEGFRVEFVGDGDAEGRDGTVRGGDRGARGGAYKCICFYWPDGRPFPDAPVQPPLTARDPVEALPREHDRLGIHVDADTTTPLWNGEPLDLGWAIYVFRNFEGRGLVAPESGDKAAYRIRHGGQDIADFN